MALQAPVSTSIHPHGGNDYLLKKKETGEAVNDTPKMKITSRRVLDYGNIAVNGVAAASKLLSATSKVINKGSAFDDYLHTGSEIATRGAILGQAALGLYDSAKETRSLFGIVGQTLEIGFSLFVSRENKWLIRGISQKILNIPGPIFKGREVLDKNEGRVSGIKYYGNFGCMGDYFKAIKESVVQPLVTLKNNYVDIFKNPKLIFKSFTHALTASSTFMGAGGYIGLTPLKKFAGIIRFIGAVSADTIYALLGHQSVKDYTPDKKFNLREIFDFKKPLPWAGKIWLIAGFADPITRFCSETTRDLLTDITDASDRCASALYQASLFDTGIHNEIGGAAPTTL